MVRDLSLNRIFGEVDNGCQAVLKTVAGETVAGSNPVLSASGEQRTKKVLCKVP